jgi:hypothetical protein
MTRDRDVNIALDVLMAIPGNEGIVHNGNFFWLTEKQANLLRTMGASFAKMHVKKWIPDPDNEEETTDIKNLGGGRQSQQQQQVDGVESPERKKGNK